MPLELRRPASARATAMGGNYRAVAADWSAMYWNPAGLILAPPRSSSGRAASSMPPH
ncbi:hypothetical protein JXA02_14085 [candidate division KSB1 bacterium]|nr:hypothetical protein [candidate division KSB1 bacterium]